MPRNDTNENDYSYEELPKCPYCDCTISIQDNEFYQLYEEERHEITCPNCEKDMEVYSSASWSFSTHQLEE